MGHEYPVRLLSVKKRTIITFVRDRDQNHDQHQKISPTRWGNQPFCLPHRTGHTSHFRPVPCGTGEHQDRRPPPKSPAAARPPAGAYPARCGTWTGKVVHLVTPSMQPFPWRPPDSDGGHHSRREIVLWHQISSRTRTKPHGTVLKKRELIHTGSWQNGGNRSHKTIAIANKPCK